MKSKDYTLLAVLTPFLIVILYYVVYYYNDNKHRCYWEDCGHYGQVMNQHQFVSQWGYEELTDGWCVEMTHFMNPDWTYEQCEDYVFAGIE